MENGEFQAEIENTTWMGKNYGDNTHCRADFIIKSYRLP